MKKKMKTRKKKNKIPCVRYCTTATVRCICPWCTEGDDEIL